MRSQSYPVADWGRWGREEAGTEAEAEAKAKRNGAVESLDLLMVHGGRSRTWAAGFRSRGLNIAKSAVLES
jgi:hypothetical protein